MKNCTSLTTHDLKKETPNHVYERERQCGRFLLIGLVWFSNVHGRSSVTVWSDDISITCVRFLALFFNLKIMMVRVWILIL